MDGEIAAESRPMGTCRPARAAHSRAPVLLRPGVGLRRQLLLPQGEDTRLVRQPLRSEVRLVHGGPGYGCGGGTGAGRRVHPPAIVAIFSLTEFEGD